jgi:hypothetical protein
LRLQKQLLYYGVNVVIIESDATWFQNGAEVEDLLRDKMSKHDVVSADDTGKRHVSAGFLGISASLKTQEFFRDYVQTYETTLLQHRHQGKYLGDVGEQHTMQSLLRASNIDIAWLDPCNFARGQWYDKMSSFRQLCYQPWVLQNNWIIGNEAKILRAKKWGHWFLGQSGAACGVVMRTDIHDEDSTTRETVIVGTFLFGAVVGIGVGFLWMYGCKAKECDRIFQLTKKIRI